MSKFVWVKIEGSRAVEVEVTEIRNINALIQFLKIKFEVSSPEHLLVINQHGMEIPADSLVSNAVSTFKQPLELLALDRNSSDVPRYTSLGESSTTTSPRNEFEFMQTPPFFGNLHEAANRDYFKIPVKPLILIILFLETISTFNLMIWVSGFLMNRSLHFTFPFSFLICWDSGQLRKKRHCICLTMHGYSSINSGSITLPCSRCCPGRYRILRVHGQAC